MRPSFLALASLAALAAGSPAAGRAGDLLPPPPGTDVSAETEASAAVAARRPEWALPRWGLALGAGFPDFATASLMFRPVSRVRLYAGPSWNYLGWGVQGGVALVPWSVAVSPVLSAEAGRFFGNDLRFLAKSSSGTSGMKPLLRNVDYTYAALDLGLELGSQSGFCFSLRLGLSYVSIAANGTTTYPSGSNTVTLRDPAFHGTLPSVKLGMQYWF